MKTSKYFLLLLFPFLFACNSDDKENDITEETKELKLSVGTEPLSTENIDFEFEILDGNGGYTATVSETDGDPDAKVTIDGNRVIVNLLIGNHLGARITITDQKEQKESVYIESTHESLHIPNFGLFLDEGKTYTMSVEFGAGAPYTIEKVRGDASEALIEENKVKATSLAIGDTYYKVRDKRGSVARLLVSTTLQFEMTMASNYLEFDGVNNLSASIRLQWGTEWEIVGSTDKVTERVSVSQVLLPTGELSDYYVLFINTADKGKGIDTVTLRNKDGDLAVVRVRVR